MKKLSTFILFFLFLTSCLVSEKNFPHENKPWEGWAGHPETPGKKPYDFYYLKSSARASQKSIEKQSLLMLRDSCKTAANTIGKSELITKIINDSLEKCSEGCEEISSGKTQKIQTILSEIKSKDCRPTATLENFEGSEWRECECIVFAYLRGGKDELVRTLKE